MPCAMALCIEVPTGRTAAAASAAPDPTNLRRDASRCRAFKRLLLLIHVVQPQQGSGSARMRSSTVSVKAVALAMPRRSKQLCGRVATTRSPGGGPARLCGRRDHPCDRTGAAARMRLCEPGLRIGQAPNPPRRGERRVEPIRQGPYRRRPVPGRRAVPVRGRLDRLCDLSAGVGGRPGCPSRRCPGFC